MQQNLVASCRSLGIATCNKVSRHKSGNGPGGASATHQRGRSSRNVGQTERPNTPKAMSNSASVDGSGDVRDCRCSYLVFFETLVVRIRFGLEGVGDKTGTKKRVFENKLRVEDLGLRRNWRRNFQTPVLERSASRL